MPRTTSRRSFLRYSLAAGLVVPLTSRRLSHAAAAIEQVHIGCIGVGGKGWSDMQETSQGQQIVAICDIDEQRLAKAAELFPQAKRYTDWRKLLEQNDIDAVTISTPDHTHAPATFSAIELGKHVYTQKPLTHSIYEARKLTEAAARKGVVTQMGIQHHSNTFFKTAVKLVHNGTIGTVREAHVWTDRPVGFWEQGFGRPAGNDTPPAHIHWDLWLGVAPQRPYVDNTYHPFKWRAFWDFGTGALGDMGCHGMDPVVSALELGPPTALWSEGPTPNTETGPPWSIIHYEFPGTKRTTDQLKMVWYDGAKLPPRSLFEVSADFEMQENGILFIGDKGQLLVDYFNPPLLLPKGDFADTPVEALPADNHYTQWTDAILGRGSTSCPFSYSGPLTETVLLGNVVLRSGKKIRWNSEELAAVDAPETAGLIRREYRDGWRITGLS